MTFLMSSAWAKNERSGAESLTDLAYCAIGGAGRWIVIAKAAIEDAVEYHETVTTKRVIADVQPGYLSSLMLVSAPVDPEPFSAIRADFHDNIMSGMTHWHSPRFMAFFSCHGEYPTIIAKIYILESNFLNGAYSTGSAAPRPVATELEVIVLNWLAQELNLPECFQSKGSTRGGGVLQPPRLAARPARPS
ncbi:hypothetical protein E4U31_007407 [Claviceps sp. LM219 group G6]|nr:hypothetical protein E4U31_007407 [Claviceps sp. LM219 group G6]